MLEELCALDCRALFATHFPELAAVPEAAPRTLQVLSGAAGLEGPEGGSADAKPVFTYRVVDGVAKSSFGLHTARIAGVPSRVVQRAALLLERGGGDG